MHTTYYKHFIDKKRTDRRKYRGAKLKGSTLQQDIQLKFFKISKFGAERLTLIFGRTSTVVRHQLKFKELQLRNFRHGIMAEKANSDNPGSYPSFFACIALVEYIFSPHPLKCPVKGVNVNIPAANDGT